MPETHDTASPRENEGDIQEILDEYQELLQMPRVREIREIRVGLKELIVGLLAIGTGVLFLSAGFIAIKNHLEKKKYGYYIEKGGEALKHLTQLIAKVEGGTRG